MIIKYFNILNHNNKINININTYTNEIIIIFI